MNKEYNVLVAGVGGQGILLCSDILGKACIIEGIDVKGAEVHGMAQRGGSVEAHIRIGCSYGPRIPHRGADMLIALEPLEGARFSYYLKKGGQCVINNHIVPPIGSSYEAEEMIGIIKERTDNIISHDFTSMAVNEGSVRILNVLMLGVARRFIPLKRDHIAQSITETVKKEFYRMNLKAFESGESFGRRAAPST